MSTSAPETVKSAARKGRRSFVQDAVGLIGNRLVIMAIGMMTGILLARCLGTSGRGVVAAITVYPLLFINVIEMGVRQSVVYHLGKGIYTNAEVVGVVSALVLLAGTGGVLACGTLLWLTGNPAFTPGLIALAVAAIPLTVFKDYSSGVFLGNRLVGQFARISRLSEVQRLLAVSLFVWLLGWGVAGALLATLLSAVVVAGFACYRVGQLASLRPRFNGAVIRALLLKGVVYAVAVSVITFNTQIGVVVMERASDAAQIGLYAVGAGIANVAGMFPQAVSTALFSHSATARDEKAFSHKVARLLRVTLLFAGLCVGLLAAVAPLIIPLVYGEQFRPSGGVLQILLPGVLGLLVTKTLHVDLAARGRPNASLWIMTPALILNGFLCLLWVPEHGARGAALAAVITSACAGVGMVLLYARLTGLPLAQIWRYQRSDFEFLRRWLPGGTKAAGRAG